jgi:hypothetical protein
MDVLSLPLTRGFVTTVDADRFESLLAYHWTDGRESFSIKPSSVNWMVNKSKCKFYATGFIQVDGERAGIKLHRLLTECPSHLLADHRDGDTMRNVMENLRVCTSSQNRQNSACSSRLGFKGVLRTRNGTYRATLKYRGVATYLGTFPTAEQAALAYDAAAREQFGEYARLNFAMHPPRLKRGGVRGLGGE